MTCMNGLPLKITLPSTYPNSAGTHCPRYKWMPNIILGRQVYIAKQSETGTHEYAV